ncbi:hypothetical protein Patl1_15113 [Pistacia atlantica]|uniref:Uncharacterized protein n=1 Tax=Pistacia atlantica TaxID=434234 RepID=A0ACC1B9R4_9ROSI|nr:hypothetical protein Patl1_15113 [Pistacia atlantica]
MCTSQHCQQGLLLVHEYVPNGTVADHLRVADFGLSRWFPTDVTHVSTATQESQGYVDPEYYCCYELTDRSDVYSFEVVLIELILSMPAVDKNRHRHEINLADFTIDQIQKCVIEELLNPCLGDNCSCRVGISMFAAEQGNKTYHGCRFGGIKGN